MDSLIKQKIKMKSHEETLLSHTLLKEFGIKITRKAFTHLPSMETEWLLKDLEAAYKQKAKKYHPDIGGDAKTHTYYTTLYNILKRRLYSKAHGIPYQRRDRVFSPTIVQCLKDMTVEQAAKTLNIKTTSVERLKRYYKKKLDDRLVPC